MLNPMRCDTTRRDASLLYNSGIPVPIPISLVPRTRTRTPILARHGAYDLADNPHLRPFIPHDFTERGHPARHGSRPRFARHGHVFRVRQHG
jgi:hypothetical protein